MLRLLIIIIVCATVSGCATITRGTNQDIPVSSNPVGADIIVDGMPYGRTPATIQLSRKHPHQVTLLLDGYEPYSVSVRTDMGKAMAGNCLIGGLPGMAIDGYSGAANVLTPESIHVELIRLHGTRPPPSRRFEPRSFARLAPTRKSTPRQSSPPIRHNETPLVLAIIATMIVGVLVLASNAEN